MAGSLVQLQLYQVDSFAEELFGGNPAAVVPLPHELFPKGWPSDSLLQRIARENNYSETAFLLSPPTLAAEGHDYLIRWFTPTVEVDLCGHATLASAYVVLNHLGHPADAPVRFLSPRSGPLIVTPRPSPEGWLTMNFPTDDVRRQDQSSVSAELLSALGLDTSSVLEAYRGKTDWLLMLNSTKTLRQLRPNFAAVNAAAPDARGVIVTARVQKEDADTDIKDAHFISRFFAPQGGVDEDPVTGSSFTTLTPVWTPKLLSDENSQEEMVARQVSPGRMGLIRCRFRPNTDRTRVEISGAAILYSTGTIHLPKSLLQ